LKLPKLWILFFFLPYAIGILVFILGPVLFSLYMSLTDWSLFGRGKLVGIENYLRIFRSPTTGASFVNTVYYVVLVVPTQIVLSVLLALMLNVELKTINIFRAVFFMPFVLSLISVGLIWSWFLSPTFGFVNQVLSFLSLPTVGWLSDPPLAMPSIAIATLWRNLGYYVTIFLAALQSMPSELYDAARVDGARGLHIFSRITLPLLTPTIFFSLVVGTIWAWQVFDLTYSMTKGGPGIATLSINLHIYQTAFFDTELGYASAQGWMLLVLILGFTLFYFKGQKLWVFYGE